MSLAVSGFGTLVKREVPVGSGTYVAIAEVKSINGPNLSTDTIDVTHMASPGGYREFIASFKDGGEVTFELNFLPQDGTQDASTGLIADFNARLVRSYQIAFPDPGNSTATFSGLITGFSVTEQMDQVLGANCTIKVSGAIVWA